MQQTPLENRTVSQVLKQLPTSYIRRKFNTVFTAAWHLSLSWPRRIQPTTSRPSSVKSSSIRSSHTTFSLSYSVLTITLLTPWSRVLLEKLSGFHHNHNHNHHNHSLLSAMHAKCLTSLPWMQHVPPILSFLIGSPQ